MSRGGSKFGHLPGGNLKVFVILLAVTIFAYALSLGTPWYFTYMVFKDGEGRHLCNGYELRFWTFLVCGGGCECANSFYNWRDKCTEDCTFYKTVWSATACFVAASLITFIATVVKSFSEWNKMEEISTARRVSASLSLLFLVVAIIFFAVALPAARKQSVCNNGVTDPQCDSFFGKQTSEIDGDVVTMYWGGFGWFICIINFVMLIVAVVQLLKKQHSVDRSSLRSFLASDDEEFVN